MKSPLHFARPTISQFTAGRGEGAAILVFAALVALALNSGLVRAADIAGFRIDTGARVAGTELALNGVGLRQFFFTDVYIIGLYFPQRTTSAAAAIDAPGAKRIALTFMREVTAQALVDALYEGIRDNSSDAELARVKPAADALAAIMLPLQLARKGDVVALDYVPDAGAQIVMNGRAIGRPVPGRDLYRALLRIWLGQSPVDGKLKRALLAGKD